MKDLPPLSQRSDVIEARKVLGREPQRPVGLLLGKRLHAQLVHRGVKFPCPVAVDPMIHPEHEQWFYLTQNFQPHAEHLIP
jgi:hypothetical protein